MRTRCCLDGNTIAANAAPPGLSTGCTLPRDATNAAFDYHCIRVVCDVALTLTTKWRALSTAAGSLHGYLFAASCSHSQRNQTCSSWTVRVSVLRGCAQRVSSRQHRGPGLARSKAGPKTWDAGGGPACQAPRTSRAAVADMLLPHFALDRQRSWPSVLLSKFTRFFDIQIRIAQTRTAQQLRATYIGCSI